MSVYYADSSKTLSLQSGQRVVFDVGHLVHGSVQCICSSWSGGVITLKRSNDGKNWHALEFAETISANGMTKTLDLLAFRYLAVECTSAGGTSPATVTFYGKSQ